MARNTAILAFDTSAAHCAAALLLGETATCRTDEMARGQAEHLIGMLDEILSDAGLRWRDLAGFGVGIGPGNFTGIRIGVAAARGLALGLGIPAVGVSGFEVNGGGITGTPVPDKAGAPVPDKIVAGRIVCLPAPRGQAYVQHCPAGGTCGTPRLVDPSEANAGLLPDEIGLASFGPSAGMFAAYSLPVLQPETPTILLAERIARIARGRLAAGEVPRPAPLYIRAADAAPPRDPAPVLLP